MNDLFALSMPWYVFVLRGAVCYLGLLFLLRCTGKRAFGEMSPFDIVVLIMVGGGLRAAMVGKDASLLGPFISVGSILILDKALGWLTARSSVLCRIVEGSAVLLVRDGALVPGILRRHDIAQAAFARELRSHEVESTQSLDAAHLEANGRITVRKRVATV